jgi:prefoldin subunit 5
VYAYLLTSQGITEKTALTGVFLKQKMQEYQQLKEEIEALRQEALLVKDAIKDVYTTEVEVSVNG